MQKTNIQYLTHTWNPIAMRCSKCSPGCQECWHLARCDMFKNNPQFSKELREIYAGDRPQMLIEGRLNDPAKRKKPARIGFQFMGDPFHEDVTNEDLIKIDTRIGAWDWHTYLILTKRPQRMKEYYEWAYQGLSIPRNLWLGVSVCNDDEKWKIDELRAVPAAIRWISFEPLLEDMGEINLGGISWCVVGGETGSGARPMDPEWARDLKNQAVNAGVPFFFKQWGEWAETTLPEPKKRSSKHRGMWLMPDGSSCSLFNFHSEGSTWMEPIGKKKAGRLLDGKEYNEYPKQTGQLYQKGRE